MGDGYYLILTIIIVLLIFISAEINQLRNEIRRTHTKLDKIANEIGVTDELVEFKDEVFRQLIKDGKKIKAIKRYRTVTSSGLKEAKEYVDSLLKNNK